ncbi:hypothetical protein WMF31_36550 [Sorangium sp. So ce1036]|uniref:hypothetical protein n=1 Tax=Sorangium sp. So ce1036 TaxID=3133328 RepID=UPI003F07C03A
MSGDATIEIFFAAFIHKKLLAASDGWTYEPVTGKRGAMEAMFKGDERGFGQHDDALYNSRLWSRVSVKVGQIGSLPQPVPAFRGMLRSDKDSSGASIVDLAAGIVCDQPGCKIESWVGPSRRRTRLARSVVGVPVGPPASVAEVNWMPWVVVSKTAPNKSKPPVVRNLDALTSTIDIECAAAYPFIDIAPDIDFGYKITLSRRGPSGAHVKVDGWHNRFPFYELLICKTSFLQYEPSSSGPNFINLGIMWRDFVAETVIRIDKGSATASESRAVRS